jgi:1,4-alpha-glucan branching enzyme
MYKKFIDECHKRGMAVILDIVLNHATGIHPYAKLWWNSSASKTSTQNPYFNVDAPHPYSVFHDFNHTYAGTKEMFKRMVQYWITEYKVDGYRLDLTKGFTQTSSTEATASNYDQSRIDNIAEYYNAAKAAKSDVMFILEHFCADNEEMQLAYKGMYLWRNVNNAYSQSAMGYQSSSDFSRMSAGPRNWVGYAESHDEERNFYKAKAFGAGNLMTDSLARVARVPLNIAFTTLIPGPKMIWQFGEMGYDYSINFGVNDKGELVNSSDYRTYPKPSAWSYLNLAHRKAAYDASSKIISLRRLYPDAFTTGSFSLQVGEADWNAGRRIALTHADLNMVALGNFRTDATISANPGFQKTGTWYELLSGETLNVTNTSMAIDIPAGGLKIYTDRKIIFNTAVDELEINADCEVYPTTTEGRLFISTDSKLKSVKVYNLQGALQMQLSDKKEIDIDQLNNGLYLLEVTTDKAKSVHRIVKK